MNRQERMISTGEIRQVIEHGDIVEDYPEDVRGPSRLMLGRGEPSRPIHIVCERVSLKNSEFAKMQGAEKISPRHI